MIHPDDIAQAVLGILSVQSLYALVLFPFIWGLVKCCRGRYPRWQHGLWFLILLRLVLPPDTAFTWSASNFIRSFTPHVISRPFFVFSQASFNFHEKQEPSAASFSNVIIHDSENPSERVQTTGSNPAKALPSTAFELLCLFICCVWLTVVTFLLVRFLHKRHRFWKIARQGKMVLNPTVLDVAKTWRRRLHIRRKIELKVVASNAPTFTIGVFRPVVALPDHLISPAGDTTFETVLAHELVHVKRWDDLSIYFQELVRIIYFFHPIVWFVMPRLTWAREAACDAAVLSHGTISPRTYGKQMLAFFRGQTFFKQSSKNLAEFTSAARGMVFRLTYIQKENNMKSHSLKMYLVILILGLFLLPMAPVVSSQNNTVEGVPDSGSQVIDASSHQMADNILTQYIMSCVPCENPEEVSRIIWRDFLTEDLKEEDFPLLIARTDYDIVDNIGDGQSAYVFYLLGGSRQGVYRPNFHFIKSQNKLMLLFKSRNVSTYVTDRPKINGRYEIAEGWRADLFNGINDDRVKLAWGSRVWFWTGTQYLPAYTDYTVKDATDPSLLGTRREWERDNQSLYEAASQM